MINNTNNIPNTIVVNEKRDTINKFRNWYKEKIIDTGVSKKFEEGLINYHKTQEKLVDFLGKITTVVLIIIPADGPLGESISILSTPLISKVITLQNKINENNIITTKRNFEANFIKADGSSEKVVLPEMNLDEIIKEVKDVMIMISDLDTKEPKGVKK